MVNEPSKHILGMNMFSFVPYIDKTWRPIHGVKNIIMEAI